MTPFIIITSALFFVLGIIWGRSNLGNVFLKVVFLALSIWGLILTLQTFGILKK